MLVTAEVTWNERQHAGDKVQDGRTDRPHRCCRAYFTRSVRAGFKCVEALGRIGWATGRAPGL